MKISADSQEKTPTPSQQQAIDATGKWLAVVAGAGSGKTTVLINRCVKIINKDPSGLSRMLAITFTEKAAAELLSKLRKNLSKDLQNLLSTAWVGTFHYFCARCLRAHAPMVNMDPSFQIIDENASRLLAHDAAKNMLLALLGKKSPQALLLVEELEFQSALLLITDLMDFRWHADKAFENSKSEDEKEAGLIDAAFYCYKKVREVFAKQMETRGTVDFQGLEIKTLELLTKYPAIRRSYQKKFRHILVDEFQDTNDLQAELVFLLADPKTNFLAIVGDPMQSIYRFRGANVHCFDEAVRKIRASGGDIINLQENFRSSPTIVSFVNLTFDDLGGKIERPPLIAAKKNVSETAITALVVPQGEDVRISASRRREAEAIASHILELKSENFKFSDIACLFRAMTSISDYERAFRQAQIPCRIYGGRSLLDRQEIRDAMLALNYASDPNDNVSLLGLLRSPLIGFSDDNLAMMAGPNGRDLRSALNGETKPHLLKFLESSAKHLRPSEILTQVMDITDYALICENLDPSGGMQANIDRLISLAQSIEDERPTSLKSFIMYIKDLRGRGARLGDPPALGFGTDAVSCMTVHTAKGLEFPVVIIPDLLRTSRRKNAHWRFLRRQGLSFRLKDPAMPFGSRIETRLFKSLNDIENREEAEEAKRLLYVAMTRAQDRLVLPIHQGSENKGEWHGWILPIIEKTKGRQLTKHDPALLMRIAPKKPPHIPPAGKMPTLAETANKVFSVTQLETFERCPYEYYLKYILGLPQNPIFPKKDKLPAALRGSIIHSVLQKFNPSKNLDELIKMECLNYSVPEENANALKEPLLNFAKSPLAGRIALGRREVRFDTRFNGAVISGTIDWLGPVVENKAAYEIWDFKTDRIDISDARRSAEEYELQIATYALAAKRSLDAPVTATGLYFLEIQHMERKGIDSARLDAIAERLKKIIDGIYNREFKYCPNKTRCETCQFRVSKMCLL